MTKRPTKFKLDAYRAYNSGLSPLEAFQKASSLNANIPLSKCMTTKAWASSYMSDDICNWIRKQIVKRNAEVLLYFDTYNLSVDF